MNEKDFINLDQFPNFGRHAGYRLYYTLILFDYDKLKMHDTNHEGQMRLSPLSA